ncbi:TPA: hypothetical protein ACH3X1_011793 [Trebouxia sp. C0004]
MKLDVLVFEMAKDQPAALPDGEGVATDEELHQAYINAVSDRYHVVAVLAAWIDAVEKKAQQQIDDAVERHLLANKPNNSTGRANKERSEGPVEPAAGETEKEDDGVAVVGATDEVIVRAIMNTESMSASQRTKAVITYLQSRQANDYQPRSQDNAGRPKPIELIHGKPEPSGKEAKDWVSTVEIYLDSVNEKRPVPVWQRTDRVASIVCCIQGHISGMICETW